MTPILRSNPSVSLPLDPNAELAFVRFPDGHGWIGIGPFQRFEKEPDADAFYVNRFDLKESQPWWVPTHWLQISAEQWTHCFELTDLPQVNWHRLEPDGFKSVFLRIRREIVAGRWRKMVPVLTQSAQVEEPLQKGLLARALHQRNQLWTYGYVNEAGGMVGATPELLFELKGSELRTMALAGTASEKGVTDFISDTKEIEEHEIVAKFLQSQLESLGTVQREAREVSKAAGLTHFRTNFSVNLEHSVDFKQLVQMLHPTPAVGSLPRDEKTFAQLMKFRELLGTPEHFGAPFGLKIGENSIAVVAIRNVIWQATQLQIASGCGVVIGSSYDHEWRELHLKRDTVASMFGL